MNLNNIILPNIYPKTMDTNNFAFYFTSEQEYNNWDVSRTTHRGISSVPWFDDINCTPFIDKFIQDNYKFNGSYFEFNYFEWGIGGSTIHYGNKAAVSYCAEHSVDWINRISSYLYTFNREAYSRINIIYKTNPDKYIDSINNIDLMFDVILIDGNPGTRDECLLQVNNKLSMSGLLILDNVDKNISSINVNELLTHFTILGKFQSTWCLQKIKN